MTLRLHLDVVDVVDVLDGLAKPEKGLFVSLIDISVPIK